jgi:hypothetical protein
LKRQIEHQSMSASNKCTTIATAGRPSAGGRRTALPFNLWRTTLLASAPAGAVPNRQLSLPAVHTNLGAGRPSAGGRRTGGGTPPSNVGGCSVRGSLSPRIKPSSQAEGFRQFCALAHHAAEYGLPNRHIKRTCLRQAAYVQLQGLPPLSSE